MRALARKDREALTFGLLTPFSPRLPPALLRRLGPALYRGAWRALYEARYGQWLARRASSRRWLPAGHGAWDLLGAAGSWTEAFHVGRVLCSGLPPDGAKRSAAERLAAPRRCHACGSPPAWAASTPTVEGGLLARPGWAVCPDCVTDLVREHGPRALLADVGEGGEEGPDGLNGCLLYTSDAADDM
eukprot:12830360-Alexandrium_andersonii.AAC.1